jgi:hypothetical protein
MKKNKIKAFYLRNQRVGSTSFLGTFGGLSPLMTESCHASYEFAEHRYNLKKKNEGGLTEWEDLHKIVSVRNPFDQHVAQYFKINGKAIRHNTKGYKPILDKIPPDQRVTKEFNVQTPKVQKRIIENFMMHVDSQYIFFKDAIENKITNNELIGKFARSAFLRCYICWPIYTFKNEIMTSLCIKGDGPHLEKDLLEMLKLLDLLDCPDARKRCSIYLKKSIKRGYTGGKRREVFRDYKNFYNPETKKKVRQMRAMEINAHNYKF